jgi:hypothetical protein
MKKSESELAKQPSAGANLEAPVRLTPEQLESVVAGARAQLILNIGTINPTTTMGIIAPRAERLFPEPFMPNRHCAR